MLQAKAVVQVDLVPMGKPSHADSILVKEKFIHAKYAEKAFVKKHEEPHLVQQIWEAVCANDKKAVYRLIVSSGVDLLSICEQVACSSLTLAKVMFLQEQTNHDHSSSLIHQLLQKSSLRYSGLANTSEGNNTMKDIAGCSLLHLACESADIGMLELLLQYGANVNACDSRGQLPVHCCILSGKVAFAKLLLTRGADPGGVNGEGKTPIELARDLKFEDSEILSLLRDPKG